jgi:hypothetical protein
MANTIRDVKSSMLGAMMEFQLVTQEFQQEFNAPDVRRAQAAVEKGILNQWDAHQPEIAAMQAENPDAHTKATQQIEAIRNRFNNSPGANPGAGDIK